MTAIRTPPKLNAYPDTMRRDFDAMAIVVGFCIVGAAAILLAAVFAVAMGEAWLLGALAGGAG